MFEGYVAGGSAGGQLTTTTDVENYPGFPDGVLGPDMMDLFRKQAQKFGAQCFYKHVSKVNFSNSPLRVYVGDEEYLTKSVIVSTGASARLLGLDAENELMGHGVSTCATCDGYFFKDKEAPIFPIKAKNLIFFLYIFLIYFDFLYYNCIVFLKKMVLNIFSKTPLVPFNYEFYEK